MNPNNIETLDELSPMQQAMLFHSLMAPGSGVYVLQMSLRLTGRLDLAAFERAWRSLVTRHSILRTAFFWEDLETPRQVAFREVDLVVERTCWCDLDAAEQEERLTDFLAADRARGFELTEAPLLRLTLFELAEDVHQLVWTQHHLVTDGWSQGLVLQELLQTYAAFVAGCAPVLPPAPSFHDYLTWLKRQDLGAAEAFWRQSLEGFSTPTFLAAREERMEEPEPDGTPGPSGINARRRDLALPAAVSAALRAVARRRRLTLNTLAQGAWALLLAQESSREDVVFGVTVAGRPADLPGVESIVGPFLDTLPLRVEVAPERRLQAWLFTLQEQQVEARRYEHAPLVDVQRWSGLPAGVALFDHILVFENLLLPPETARPAGLLIEEGAGSSLTNYPLDVVVVPGNEVLLSLRWDAARCDTPEMVRLLERLARVLTTFANVANVANIANVADIADVDGETGDPRLGELPLLLEGERHQLLCEWNDTADARHSDLLLHQLFAAQVEARPEALAAVWKESAWTYRELAERAHRIAALLCRLGVERGTAVGVWLERSLDMLAAVLGVLEAAGTYIPLDASWPADRVETILAGIGVPVILCGRATLPAVERLRWRLPLLGDAVCLDVETAELEPEPLDTVAIRSLFDFVADRATDRVSAGGFVSRRTGLPFREAEVDEYRDRVLSLAEPWLRPGARVLEVGCGSGLILWEMARRVEHADRIVGLDPSERTQERNREHARAAGIENVELPSGFAHEIGERFAPGSFDLVLLASTVQFFPGPRYLEKVVADALALLAPGGALLLADVIDARREPAAETLALDEELFHDLGRAEIHHRTEGFSNELGERYDVILQPGHRPGETDRKKRTWTGWHVDRSPALPLPAVGSPEGAPGDIAYVIHTSGSTGLPKGIAVQHAPAVNLIHWVNRTFDVGPADRLLFVTSLAFDLSVWDIFGTLAAGGTVHVASEAALREPAELVRLLCTEPITLWDSAPAALQQLAPLFPGEAPRPLRLALLSGDWIPVPLPDQVRAAFPNCRVISLGGATEATVWSNWYPIEAVDPGWSSIPYGRPIANARYHALDAEMRPCPIGVAGDLYIGGMGGACLCVGYAGQPALTAVAFLPDPFAGEPGARLYRTGDRVRFFPDGNLEFLGRVDQQVKIRGYRIELGEIEVALLRHRQVREAVVQVLEGRLVAWIVPEMGPAMVPGTEIVPEAQDLRSWLAESLPSYMLPAAFVILAALPVTANGKLDRAALPAPELAQAAKYEAPSGPEEEMLAALWAELLGAQRVGARDNFFTLGGHSLLGTRVISRLREAFEVEVPLRDLFEAPVLSDLAARIATARSSGTVAPALPLVPVPREGPLPLSFAQQRLWFLDQLEPGSPLYNIPVALRVEGPLRPAVLTATLGEILRRHESLRTSFAVRDSVPVQVIQPTAPFVLPAVDLSGLPASRREALARLLVGEEAGRPFDLARGPLLRGLLLRLGDSAETTEHAVALTMHHIASDGWSIGILVREVAALYAALSKGRPSPLPELPVQYADFAAWQGSWLQGEVLEGEISFWRQQLAGLPPLLELPTDRPRPAAQSYRGSSRPLRLPAALVRQTTALSQQEGATLFMVLLAGFQALLARTSGQPDLAVGSPIAGRNRVEIENLIGFFVNTLVLRGDMSGNQRGEPSFRELLGRTRETALAAYLHQDVPFEKLVEELAPERSLAQTPLFQAMLVLQNVPLGSLTVQDLHLHPLEATGTTAKFDLTVTLAEHGGGLNGSAEYATDLFDGTTIDRLLGHFERLLAAALEAPERRVAELSLLSEAERGQILKEWNDTGPAVVPHAGAHELFTVQARRTPDTVAVICGNAKLSYADLAERAGRVARHLCRLGVGPDVLVGLFVERSLDMIIGVLGILQAGGAYVPLDPGYPGQRLAFMLEDTRTPVVLTQESLRSRVPAGQSEIVLLDNGGIDVPETPEIGGEAAEPSAANLAYVVYTSGSTGRPKGVSLSHGTLRNLIDWHLDTLLGGVRTLQLASVSFDASFHEMFACWGSGGTLVVAVEEQRRDMQALADVLVEQQIEKAIFPVVVLTQLAEIFAGRAELPPLREITTTGERLQTNRAMAALLERLPECAFHNHYGPSETHVATAFTLGSDPAGWAVFPSIGRPILGSSAYVLEPGLEPAPAGVPGDLYLGGVCVARGYLGRPDLTAERFVPDPFSALPEGAGGRLYRTGDKVRVAVSGELEYLGRFDDQVKVRGFRVEPAEIEEALLALPGVREAVVLAREDRPASGSSSDRRLVAYVVGTADAADTEDLLALRERLRERLPDYMVPAAIMILAEFPLTSNGKVDKRALPAPEWQRPEESYQAPRTPVEEVVAGIWAEVLGLERVGAADHFFSLGGHSLLATQVMSRLRNTFGIELALRELFESPTVAGLAARVERARRSEAELLVPPLVPVPRNRPLPLSFAQQRLWFIDQLEPGSPLYNMPAALRVEGPLRPTVLAATLGEIVRRHEALRTVFTVIEGSPIQVTQPALPFVLPLVDLSALPERERAKPALALVGEEAGRPFDLARGPLLRGVLVRLAREDSVVALTMHHIASDGWSIGILVREIAALYAALAGETGDTEGTESRPSPLPELPVQYADFALWQHSWLQGEVLETEIAFWRRQLTDLPPLLELPTDRPRPAAQSYRGSSRPLRLPTALTRQAADLSRREGATLFMVLLAGFQALLARTSGQQDLAVGSPIAGRNRVEIENLIGFFVNTLVLRGDLTGEPTFRELLGRIRETALAAYLHQDVPFEKLVEELAPERSLAQTPLFQAMLVLQNAPLGSLEIRDLRLHPLPAAGTTAKFDLTVTLTEHGGGLSGSAEYATDLFDDTTIDRLLGHFERLLAAALEAPERRVAELPLLSEAERGQILNEWNDTGPALVPHSGAQELFTAQARRTPDAVAVVCEDAALTYADLADRAGRLARHLRRLGVGPDVLVGLFVERSLDMIVGVLGVLQAGGAYVPLDPGYPGQRLAFMLEDTRAPVVLTQESLRSRVPAGQSIVLLADGGGGGIDVPETPEIAGEAAEPSASNLAYVIYTSGSTGRPKGVSLSHGALRNLIDWHLDTLLGGVRTLQLASVSFDASFHEMFACWGSGGTLVVAVEEQRHDMQALADLLVEQQIEKAIFPVVVLTQLAEIFAGRAELPPLREITTTGERLQTNRAMAALLERLPECAFHNHYGPSETHVATAFTLGPDPGGWAVFPSIGRPILGSSAYVLEPGLEPAPAGVPGDLYLGGVCVARGYLGRPDLTAERFVPDPFSALPEGAGGRLYRTGDKVRVAVSGELEYLGRFDDQVKIRGFRVEPAEIEEALLALPGVREAVVLAREDRPAAGGSSSDRRLVAYVVGTADAADTEELLALRERLRERLPDYMVPAAIVVLAALPLTSNGKVDKRALPAPEWQRPEESYQAPRTPVEEVVAGIWAEVLGLERVGATDHFFTLGGHSLLATQVMSRLRSTFGIELALRELFEAPTVAGLAARVEAARRTRRSGAAAPAQPLPPITPVPREGPLPLSFAQQRLWFIDQLEPGSPLYNMPVALGVEGPLDAGVLALCLGEIVRRHESLRTVFAVSEGSDGAPVQVIQPAVPFILPLVDLSSLPESRRELQARALASEEAARPFDLACGPLLRGVLLRLAPPEEPTDHVVVLTVHHIASDGWSMGILVREIVALYAVFAEGQPSPLPELPIQYVDFVVWQHSWLRGEVLENEISFWRRQLAGLPPLLDLPTDRPRPAAQSYRGAARPVHLPAVLTQQTVAFARHEGATLFMVLLAAFQALLARTSGQDHLAVGSPVAGRNRMETEGLIGFFVNTLVLRGDLSDEGRSGDRSGNQRGGPTFRELLGRVRETALAAWLHQDVPFEKLVQELAPERRLSHSPLFQVMLVLQNVPVESLEARDLRFRPMTGAGTTAKFDLTLSLGETSEGLDGALEYAIDLFDSTTVERFLGHLAHLLAGAISDSEKLLSELPLLARFEQHQLLTEWNDTGSDRPHLSIPELFAQQVERTPDAVALMAEDRLLTYRELNREADQLAHRLLAASLEPDAPVGVFLERSPELIVALLGVLKAGAAYLVLDPDNPAERLRVLIKDARLRLVVSGGRSVLAEDITVIDVDGAGGGEPVGLRSSPSHLAYISYTSGSTGRPKGVCVEHRAVVRLVTNTNYLQLGPEDVFLQHSPVSFDASTLEIWGPLLNGGRLAVCPPGRLSTEELGGIVQRFGVNALWLTAGLFHAVVENGEHGLPALQGLRYLLAGGDVLSPEHVRAARAAIPGARLINGYGPTENTTFTCFHPVGAELDTSRSLPIGRPIANTRVHVLDSNLNLVSRGVTGELCTGGAGLARGYFSNPALTAERFIPDPFGTEPGDRLYPTGDRVRRLADGRIEFLGRLDQQVKIRGFRVEPGEIEAVLARHPGVSEAVVVTRESALAGRRLAAYVTLAEGMQATGLEELRSYLTEILPEPMVPTWVLVLDRLPLTPNGKVYRKALPAPERQQPEAGWVAPRTPVEEIVASIWAEVFGLERVGAADHFFALGGHSLLAAQVLARLRSVFGVEMPLRDLFEAPVLADLAVRVQAARRPARPRL